MKKERIKIELMFPEKVILEEIADKAFTRDSIAQTYAFCRDSREKIDGVKVNTAIVERWSMSGLEYIKSKAWKLLKERRK